MLVLKEVIDTVYICLKYAFIDKKKKSKFHLANV